MVKLRSIFFATVLLMAGFADTSSKACVAGDVARADSVLRVTSPSEVGGMMQRRMVQSAYPVTISMRGNAVCVRSKYDQLLPVYTQNGAFYAAFRLTRGTNWLSGLPRGTYLINNQRVTVS